MSQVRLQLEKLEEAEAKVKPIIHAIQQEIDESAKELATQNAEYQKQKQELEIGKKLALEKCQKEVEEKYLKENAELESKNWERNANFVKEMTTLKERLKDKVNWSQVDLLMGKKLALTVIPIVNPPIGNRWNLATTTKSISIFADGLKATNNGNTNGWQSVSAEKEFAISMDSSGPVVFYFEVTNMSSYTRYFLAGLSCEDIPDGSYVGGAPNSYGFQGGCDHDQYYLSEKSHPFVWPNGAIRPKWKGQGDVIGCGLLLNPAKELSIFFTGNGILMGKKILINHTVDHLYPTVSLYGNCSVEANFGNDSAKPFCYDIKKCPGIDFI